MSILREGCKNYQCVSHRSLPEVTTCARRMKKMVSGSSTQPPPALKYCTYTEPDTRPEGNHRNNTSDHILLDCVLLQVLYVLRLGTLISSFRSNET